MFHQREYNFGPEQQDTGAQFRSGEVLQDGLNRFSDHLRNVSLRTLVAYIEANGGKIDKIDGIPKTWGNELEKQKASSNSLTINSGLYFVPRKKALTLAIEELK